MSVLMVQLPSGTATVCFSLLALLLILCNTTPFTSADNDALQDLCPTADKKTTPPIFLNGHLCKNPNSITASDFKSSNLNHPGDVNNYARSSTNILTAAEFPGLNTMGLSIARTDIDMDGAVTPHYHPRATETFFVERGTVIVGFGDSKGRLFIKVLKEGDVFLVPRGLPHFCVNAGYNLATLFSTLNSQNPGLVSLTGVLYSSVENLLPRMLSLRTSNNTAATMSFSDFFRS